MENPFSVLFQLAGILEEQGITYVLVGSLASSMHGMYRSSADIDILADVKPQHVRPLINALGDAFYIDEQAVNRAIDLRQSFNAIHLDSVFKVDIFIPKADAFTNKQLERRELRRIAGDVEWMIYVATAEDTILAKLRSYLSGGRVSNTQWTDVVGIIGGSSARLDVDYLQAWAEALGLTELLEEAFEEAKNDDRGTPGK
jgi:hypothetical protein